MQVVAITEQFNTGSKPMYARQIDAGSVNETYIVDMADGTSVVMHKINQDVFRDPVRLIANTYAVTDYLGRQPHAFPHPEFYRALDGKLFFIDPDGQYWRASRSIKGIFDDQNSAILAAKLGHTIGGFHRALADFPVESLNPTFPHYHNTPRRFQELAEACSRAPKQLLDLAPGELGYLQKQQKTCSALLEKDLVARVTHNDVRPQNLILLPENGNPKCIVNYDAVMPGILAFDYGDGARSVSYTCNDDESNMSRVKFELGFFEAFTKGFVSQTKSIVEDSEPSSLALGCVVMTLERGMRYMTDFLSGNRAFRVEYPIQNLNRARVQLFLCMQMQDNYQKMCQIVKKSFI